MQIVGRLRLVYNKYANTNKCINFKTKEQENNLISQFVGVSLDSNVFMQDGDTILVPLNYEECIKYNYCYFHNQVNERETKRYFCYITNYQYVEPSVTRITIAVDTLQTFLFDIQKLRGNISRCHSARRINIGTEQTPRYVINPDLYFMEDEVDVYKPVVTEKASNPHPTYMVLTYAIPVNTKSSGLVDDDIGKVSVDGKYYEKVGGTFELESSGATTNEVTLDKGTIQFTKTSYNDIAYTDGSTRVFNRYNNYQTRGIGNTQLFAIIIETTTNQEELVKDNKISYETFRKVFPLLQDKLVDTFYIDNIGDIEFGDYVELNVSVGAVLKSREKYSIGIIPYSQTLKLKKLVSVSSNELNPNYWVNRPNDSLIVRRIDQEKKLDLYPYTFVKIHSMGSELVWKYQEVYKFILLDDTYTDNCYSYLKCCDCLSPNPHMISTLLYSIDNLKSIDSDTLNDIKTNTETITNNYLSYSDSKELPSVSIFQEKYTEYLNYQKAIVDANNHLNMVGGIVKGGFGIGSSVAKGNAELDSINKWYAYDTYYARKRKKEKLEIAYESDIAKAKVNKGIGIVGGVIGALEGIGNYITTAVQETALKRQPMNVLHQGIANDELYTTLYDNDGNIFDYVITKYECIDNIKSTHEQKFYNYGYSIPVDVEFTRDEFINIISNRRYFCYMEWNSLEIESYIPTIYVNDIVARLTNGVRFENTGDSALYQTYTINDNNKETSIPAKPFFVRNY